MIGNNAEERQHANDAHHRAADNSLQPHHLHPDEGEQHEEAIEDEVDPDWRRPHVHRAGNADVRAHIDGEDKEKE